MHLTGLCMHVLHALPHDITGQCMQLLHGLFSINFISDIPLSPATLLKAQCQSGNKKSFISLNLGQKYFIVEGKTKARPNPIKRGGECLSHCLLSML
jgi:hypothetical protein